MTIIVILSLLQLNLASDRGNELTHKGIQSVAEGLGYVPQLTILDIRSAVTTKYAEHFIKISC
jgi:hypothetical protein